MLLTNNLQERRMSQRWFLVMTLDIKFSCPPCNISKQVSSHVIVYGRVQTHSSILNQQTTPRIHETHVGDRTKHKLCTEIDSI